MAGAGVEFRELVVNGSAAPPVNGGVAVSKRILHGISLRVEPGTTVALLGRSGSGKTTLLRTVNGLVRASSGEVLVEGRSVGSLGTMELIAQRRGVGYVIQETGLYPHMTVERNVAMPLELAGRAVDERCRRAAEVLQMVGLAPEKFAQRMPWQLSGGQRQRAGVARALCGDPTVLLMDEPFGALDPLTRAEMQEMLRELLRRLGKTALIVTHDLQEAVFLADRVVFIDEGRVAADLPAGEVLRSEIPMVAEYVRAVNRFEAVR